MTIKKNRLTRRGFLGVSLGATNVAFGYASPFKTFLKTTNPKKVRAIIEKHYDIDLSSWSDLDKFYSNILENNSRYPKFKKDITNGQMQELVETYIIEEFAVRSNYLEIAHYGASQIKLV